MAWFFPDEVTAHTDALLERVRREGAVAPAIRPLEVANVMLFGEKRGRVTASDTDDFIALLDLLPILVDDQAPGLALATILLLARRHKLTVYDAAYLELALRLGLPLATLDKELRLAAPTVGGLLL